MTNKSDKEKEKRLAAQQEQDRLERQRQIAIAQTPPTLEDPLQAETLDYFNTVGGKNGPFDIMNVKAMTPHLGLYNNAIKKSNAERMGIGALRLSADSNPMLSALLKQQTEDRNQQAAAGQLENAFGETDALMRNQAFNIMGQQQNRNLNLANLSNSNSANSTSMWSQFQPRPSAWASLLNSAVQGATGAATSYATGGLSSLMKPKSNSVPASSSWGQYRAPAPTWQAGFGSPVVFAANGAFVADGSDEDLIVGEEGPELLRRVEGGRVVIPAPATRRVLHSLADLRPTAPRASHGLAAFRQGYKL